MLRGREGLGNTYASRLVECGATTLAESNGHPSVLRLGDLWVTAGTTNLVALTVPRGSGINGQELLNRADTVLQASPLLG